MHVVGVAAFASALLYLLLAWWKGIRCGIGCTFAVAYELGLSRRSMVLRRGAMVRECPLE